MKDEDNKKMEINAYILRLKPTKTNLEMVLELKKEVDKMLKERGIKKNNEC